MQKSTCKSHQCSSNRGKSEIKISGNNGGGVGGINDIGGSCGGGDGGGSVCKFSNVEKSFLNENQINICDSHNNTTSSIIQKENFPILKTKNDNVVELSDHIQFLITEVSAPKTPSVQLENELPPDDSDGLTEGKQYSFSFLLFYKNSNLNFMNN